EHTRAEGELIRHLEIVRRSAGAEHPVVAVALQQLAELFRQRGDLSRAEANYRQAVDLVRRSEAPAGTLHAHLLHGPGGLVRQQGRLDEAADPLRCAREADRT